MAIESGRVFCLRPPVPGGADPELLWGSVLAAAGLLGAGWLRAGLPTPLCPFHALTGLPCPACGTTRAAGCLLRGDLLSSLSWNPLGSLGLVAAVFFVGYAATVVTLRLPRLRLQGSPPRFWRLGIALLLGLNWGYLLFFGKV
jgi:Protein of unknown function (DUF2752)